MRFLVAGGAGFLGSHLCQKLLSLNHEVICVDNLSTGNLDNYKIYVQAENYNVLRFIGGIVGIAFTY